MKCHTARSSLYALSAAVIGFTATTAPAQIGGIPLWTNYYDDTRSYGLAVDRSGNAFVAGNVTIKYAPTGMPLWTRSFNGTASAVAVDKGGNAFVTGRVQSGGCVTLKYSATGLPLWTNYLSASATFAIAVDAAGKVFVAGGNADYTTVAYSNAGVPLWTNHSGPVGEPAGARHLAVDGSGNVVVAGSWGTIKYSGTGAPLWSNSAPVGGMVLEENGNVLTVSLNGVAKYSPSGSLLWARPNPAALPPFPALDGSGGLLSEVASDASGNIYAAGSSYTPLSGNFDFMTIKYSSAGQPLWTNYCDGKLNLFDMPASIALDSGGNIFVYGNSLEDYGLGDYFFRALTIAGYSSAGTPLWTNTYESVVGGFTGSCDARAVTVDPSGNVLALGTAARPTGGGGADASVIIKYSSALLPRLVIAPTSGNALAISWPSPSYGFVLQQNTNLHQASSWINVSPIAQDDGLRKTVIAPPAAGKQFYRLYKP